jgi:Trypsin-co-occurring domain 1
MTFAESRSETVPVQLPNGAIVKFEVTNTGRADVGFDLKQFQPVADLILVPRGYANEGVVQMIAAPIQKVRPKKATVKFGMEMALVRRTGCANESGQLTAVIVKGSGKANLEITLEWETPPKGEP